MNNDLSMIKFFVIILKWKKFILYNTTIVFFLIIGISLLLPNWYKSTANILPPKQQDIFGSTLGTSSLLKGLAGSKALGGLTKGNSNYNYFAILRSRTTMLKVVEKFGLLEVYNIPPDKIDDAIKTLEENTKFELQDDDNITIEVFDKDPYRATEMANFFVEILNTKSIQLATQEARNNREFIEKRLISCKMDLQNAEDQLKSFQEKKDIFISDDAKNSSIAAYAELYAEKAKKEIQIEVLNSMVSSDNQVLNQLKQEYKMLSKKLSSFPSSGLKGIRLYREVVIQQKLLEFLLPLYEQAKIEEQKDIPVLLILDKAVPPTKKAKPQRSLIVVLVTFVGLTFFITISFVLDTFEKNNFDDYPMANKLKNFVKKISLFYKVPS